MGRKRYFAIKGNISRRSYMIIAFFSFVFFIGGWYALYASGWVNQAFLPSPNQVVASFLQSLTDGSLWTDASISIYRISMGVIYAILIGVPIGLLCGCFKPVEAFIRPMYEFIRYMPVPSLVPLVLIWTGIGEEAKIMVIFLGTFFQMVLMVADDVNSVPMDLIYSSYTLGTTRLQTITKVLIPAMMPRLLLSIRMLVGWAWTYLVVAEMVAADSGLGYSILKAQRFLYTNDMYSGIIVIGVLGLITDRLFAVAIKRLFPWVEEGESS